MRHLDLPPQPRMTVTKWKLRLGFPNLKKVPLVTFSFWKKRVMLDINISLSPFKKKQATHFRTYHKPSVYKWYRIIHKTWRFAIDTERYTNIPRKWTSPTPPASPLEVWSIIFPNTGHPTCATQSHRTPDGFFRLKWFSSWLQMSISKNLKL